MGFTKTGRKIQKPPAMPRRAGTHALVLPRDEFLRQRDLARAELLRRINQRRPKVLASLAEQVLPIYRQIYQRDAGQDYTLQWVFLVAENLKPHPKPSVENEALDDALRLELILRSWAEHWGLTEEWFLNHALQTLSLWCNVDTGSQLDWVYTLQNDRQLAAEEDSVFTLWYAPWEYGAEDWKSYEKKLNAAYLSAKKQYRLRMTRVAQESAQPMARKKLELSHYDWLIDYQIPEEGKTKNKSQIAQSAHPTDEVDPKTVDEAIKTLAVLVGWQLRPPERGRPRKS